MATNEGAIARWNGRQSAPQQEPVTEVIARRCLDPKMGQLETVSVIKADLPIGTRLYTSPPAQPDAQAEIERLKREVEMLTNAGVIECAVRNASVAEYMRHWESRTEKAERLAKDEIRLRERVQQERDELRAQLESAQNRLEGAISERPAGGASNSDSGSLLPQTGVVRDALPNWKQLNAAWHSLGADLKGLSWDKFYKTALQQSAQGEKQNKPWDGNGPFGNGGQG